MAKVVVTCEHGGNAIPSRYRLLFHNHLGLLTTHRGYDIGALPLATALAKKVGDAFYFSRVSRLLVELNRSLHNPVLFSEITGTLPPEERQELLREYYFPYREAVEKKIRDFIQTGHQVVQVAVHTFTPVLEGVERQADIGLLFDPARKGEREFCERWRQILQRANDRLMVRMNYPYLGVDDGFTTYLRTRFAPEAYAGIELEVNQKFFQNTGKVRQPEVEKALVSSLAHLISSLPGV